MATRTAADPSDHPSDCGSSLVEVIIAASILAAGVLSMAHLFTVAAASNVAARSRTVAMILAGQKVEQLRALEWVDTSPGGTLAQNTSGFVDHLSAGGAVVGLGVQPPPQAVYTRRWSIDRIASSGAFILQVRVLAKGNTGDVGATNGSARRAQVVTVKTRQAP